MYIKKSVLVMFNASFLQLWTTNKTKTFKNKKGKKISFSEFYCLINAKVLNTNKKIFIKKSLLVMFIALFPQLLATSKKKIQKSKK